MSGGNDSVNLFILVILYGCQGTTRHNNPNGNGASTSNLVALKECNEQRSSRHQVSEPHKYQHRVVKGMPENGPLKALLRTHSKAQTRSSSLTAWPRPVDAL